MEPQLGVGSCQELNEQPSTALSSNATQNHQLRAQLWEAANDKARELGWIK